MVGIPAKWLTGVPGKEKWMESLLTEPLKKKCGSVIHLLISLQACASTAHDIENWEDVCPSSSSCLLALQYGQITSSLSSSFPSVKWEMYHLPCLPPLVVAGIQWHGLEGCINFEDSNKCKLLLFLNKCFHYHSHMRPFM